MTRNFDAIIIGAGQAGPFLAVRLAAAGKSVALVERKVLGGTCVNTGCTPTKTLVASAKAAHTIRDSARFGMHLDSDLQVSLTEVQSRAGTIVQNSRNSLHQMLEREPNCTLFIEKACFLSSHEVQAGDETLRGEQIFINVGGRPSLPHLPGLEQIDFLTSSSILALRDLPRHLVIVGGGYIGVEFAQMFRRFGSQVTIVEMSSRQVKHEDQDASDAVAALLQSEGIALRFSSECISFSRITDGYCVHVDCSQGDKEVHSSHVLLAMGRVPNTNDLALDAAGVQIDASGFIPVDDKLRSNVPHIWALGDCNRRGAFTHTSYNDFEIVAANLLDGESRRVTDRIPVHALYTDPPLAQVGMTEAQARAFKPGILVSTRPMKLVGRAIEKGETFGYMKVIVDPNTKRILGACIFGVGGDEAIHSILDIMYANVPYTVLQHAVHIHSTVAELIPTILGNLQAVS